MLKKWNIQTSKSAWSPDISNLFHEQCCLGSGQKIEHVPKSTQIVKEEFKDPTKNNHTDVPRLKVRFESRDSHSNNIINTSPRPTVAVINEKPLACRTQSNYSKCLNLSKKNKLEKTYAKIKSLPRPLLNSQIGPKPENSVSKHLEEGALEKLKAQNNSLRRQLYFQMNKYTQTMDKYEQRI